MISTMITRRLVTQKEKFLFDLNGFLIVRDLLSKNEIKLMNDAIDAHQISAQARDADFLKNTRSNTGLSLEGSRIDLGGILNWKESIFRKLVAHPNIAPYLITLCGEGYRMDHQPFVILQNANSEGFSLHGGPVSGVDGTAADSFNFELQYHCRNGSIYNSLLAMSVCLNETKKGDGGFAVIRGSHKLNFSVPSDFANCTGDMVSAFHEHAYLPVTNPGDVIFFSEATVHGAVPWRSTTTQRRLVLYRFSPANFAYSRAYLHNFGIDTDIWDTLTDEEKAILGQAPYATRFDRSYLKTDESNMSVKLDVMRRSEGKKAHDRAVFGTEYP